MGLAEVSALNNTILFTSGPLSELISIRFLLELRFDAYD